MKRKKKTVDFGVFEVDKDLRQKCIETILKFVQGELDLNAATKVELEIIANKLSPFFRIQLSDALEESDRVAILELQEKWRETINWIFEHLDGSWRIVFEMPFSFEWGMSKRSSFINAPLLNQESSGASNTVEARAYDLTPAQRKDQPSAIPSQSITMPPGWQSFVASLSGFPKSSLSRCPVCRKIFFNPSRRRKKFCTRRCQNRSAARDFRARMEEGKLPGLSMTGSLKEEK